MSDVLNDWAADCQTRTEEARSDPRTTDELISVILTDAEEDEPSAWQAVTTLRYRATREVFDDARALCASSCAVERRWGVDILNQLGKPDPAFPRESLAVLTPMLQTEQVPDVLSSVCLALKSLGLPETIPLIAGCRAHPDVRVRFAVAQALGMCEDPLAIESLIELSADPDADVRDWATFGLGAMNDADTPALRDALARRLNDPDRDTRAEAIAGLGRRKDERALAPLVEALSPERKKELYTIELEAAAEMEDPRLLPVLFRLRETWGKPDEEIEEAIRRCGGS